MSLERRFHLLIALALGAGFIVFATLGYLKEKAEAEENLQASAERVRNVLMATRRIYYHQFIDSGLPLNEKTLGFLPVHALNRLSKDLANWDETGFSFNNVSDHPRNPEQKADAIEMAAMEHFRQNPKDTVLFVPYNAPNGEPYYHYARPIWIEKDCLECHGDRAKAPETIRKLYDTAYDYKVGDLRGILSIKIPARGMQEQLLRGFLLTVAWTGSTLVLLWLIVGYVVRRDILHPLALLRDGITRLSGGTLSGRVGTLPSDFGDIGQAFDTMANSLEREQTRLATILRTASDGIHIIDGDGLLIEANAAFLKMLGYDKTAIGHLHVDDWDTQEGDVILKQINALMDTKGAKVAETRHRCRDGTILDVEISACGIEIEGQRFIYASSRDITDRKRAEEVLQHHYQHLEEMVVERTAQLRTLTKELAMTEERERRAIAQDLHDDLGQILAIVKLRLTSLETPGKTEGHGDLTQQVKEIESLVDMANLSVRSLSMQLSPPVLFLHGLLPALEWLAEQMQRTYGLRVHIHDESQSAPMDEAMRSSLFRNVRELLINVSKHAQVDAAEVSVSTDGNRLVITVADAGIGFDASQEPTLSVKGGYGLFSVRERLNSIGGKMEIDSRPGDGTIVVLILPLDAINSTSDK